MQAAKFKKQGKNKPKPSSRLCSEAVTALPQLFNIPGVVREGVWSLSGQSHGQCCPQGAGYLPCPLHLAVCACRPLFASKSHTLCS